MEVNEENYFDIAIALWYWLSHWHEGQFSEKYSMFCQIPLENVPDIVFEDVDGIPIYRINENDENEMVRIIYHDINEINFELTFKNLMNYLKEKYN